MIENLLKTEWEMGIAIISLIISIMTLYVSHLRGPKIILASLGRSYISAVKFLISENRGDLYVNLLFINIGNRTGILYDFVTISNNLNVESIDYLNVGDYRDKLPTSIKPGESYNFSVRIRINKPEELNWGEFIRPGQSLDIQAKYTTDGNLLGIRRHIHNFKVIYKKPEVAVDWISIG